MAKTNYVALVKDPQTGAWVEHGQMSAHSALAVRRATAKKVGGDSVQVVAVPKRSWQPKIVIEEVTVRITEKDPIPGQQRIPVPGEASS